MPKMFEFFTTQKNTFNACFFLFHLFIFTVTQGIQKSFALFYLKCVVYIMETALCTTFKHSRTCRS